ncbi:MAG: GlcG/HbpS family heme-binding protein [Candidatus Dormibacterales bacterium]
MAIPFHEAQAIIEAAHEKARSMGIRVTVAIVDEGGVLQALGRMDGSFHLSSQIAEAKALGAALWHRDGAQLASMKKDRPAFFEQVDRLVRLPLMPGLGSAVIRRQGEVQGGVGVSGAASEEDLECALAGLRAVGLEEKT